MNESSLVEMGFNERFSTLTQIEHLTDSHLGVNQSPSSQVNISRVRNIVDTLFPGLWFYNEACLAATAIMKIEHVVNPPSIILNGPASSDKTTVLSSFRNHPLTYWSDGFTARAFVSQQANKTESDLAKIDLLPKIKDKALVVPDLQQSSQRELRKSPQLWGF